MTIGVRDKTTTLPFVRKNPVPTSWKNEIEFTLSASGTLTRMESCPVRKLNDIRLHFTAPDWHEIYPFNFRFAADWKEPGVQMSEQPTMDPNHRFGEEFLVDRSGFLTVNITLSKDMVKYIRTCDPKMSKDEYLAVKFDVLARKDDKWWFVDPRLGTKGG